MNGKTQAVDVWDAGGTLLGSIKLSGAVGDLGFGEPGEVYVMGGDRIFKIVVSPSVMGA